ncbi:ATP-dependent Clp protease proteolytic subunit [bacterium]|nr:ATP-dependent Clp protease proteolytic subunit [bacterium]
MEWIQENSEEPREKIEGKLVERLIGKRTVLISRAINDVTAERVIASLVLMEEEDPVKPITVYINSPGGAADSGFAIYDVLRFVRPQVRIICSGLCASAALIIFLAGDKGQRYSLPNSRFLLHQPFTSAWGQATDLQITAKEILKLKERFNTIVAEATGKKVEQISEDANRDFWLSAKEALEYHLVDKIIASRTEIEPA